jgi:hypothetical protein
MSRIFHWLNKKYPQNFIVKKPFIGTLIFLAFCLCFVLLYKPLSLHASGIFNYEITMAIYLGAMSIPIYVIVMILKRFSFFSDPEKWTILKEMISIAVILLGMGVSIYFMGFLMESPANRWDLATFLSSCMYTFLIGVIPFLFFTVINYRHLFVTDIVRTFDAEKNSTFAEQPEEMIRIISQLKKEELSFYPSQFVYAASDGNYVIFHLHINNQFQNKIIRNSISNIEQQLSSIPFITRTHRAFIVNIKQVNSQKGNSLGYQLKFNGIDTTVPVSRQKTKDFDQLLKRYR